MKPRKSSVTRIYYACIYSRDGLLTAYSKEAAFRQEVAILAVTTPLLLFLPISLEMKLVVAGSGVIVLMAELFNSAIEAVVDIVSPDHHKLAKSAKDMGSAAVFLAIGLWVGLWCISIYTTLFSG